MRKHLFFICPMDHLESVIEAEFKEENYYLTSLGNSMDFSNDLVGEINALVEVNGIREITFVLSSDNKIISNAIAKQTSGEPKTLSDFQRSILELADDFKAFWHKEGFMFTVLSSFLQKKAIELSSQISPWLSDDIKINTQIYSRCQNNFKKTNSCILWRKLICLN